MAVFLPIVPNWKNGVRDVYEFRTSIFTSRNGSEQRRAQRIEPRRSLTVAAILDGDRLRSFADAINRARDGKVEISDFSGDPAYLVETVLPGESLLTLDEVPRWLVGGVQFTIVTGRRALKVRADFVENNIVVLTAPVESAVGSGAKILPILEASIENSNTLSIYTTNVSTTSLKFSVEPGTKLRKPDPLPTNNTDTQTKATFGPSAIFYGRYVLLRKPNYLQQPTAAFNIGVQKVDYDRGVVKVFNPIPIVSRTLSATYVGMTREDVLTILDIFLRARGQAGEIYVPTWGSDLPPILQVSVDSIKVKGSEFFDTYYQDKAHAAILIRGKDGSLRPREITHMYLSDGDTWIVCATEIGITAENISLASWLFVSRFANDALTIEWKTDGLATIVLSFTTLENLAVEDSFGSNWILATGFWRDRGVWEDSNVWID